MISSKLAQMQTYYSEYFLLGPYFEQNARLETIQLKPDEKLKSVFDELEREGIQCYYAEWKTQGRPKVILVDFKNIIYKKDELKKKYWELFGVESLFSRWDFDEPLLWSYACARVISVYEKHFLDKSIVGHFHEWMAGLGILQLKSEMSRVATVFTTHATMLGRAISGSGKNLYAMLDHMNPYELAKEHNVVEKFTAEKACARSCDVFTTVSKITAKEAKAILDRDPDVLLLNGLDSGKFPSFEQISVKHAKNRDIIRELIQYHFFPYYTFDLENNLIFFTSGRYEYSNKGIDVVVDSLSRLNELLIQNNSEKTVTLFFFVPAGTNRIKFEVLENKERYMNIKSQVESNHVELQKKIIHNLILKKHSIQELFSQDTSDTIDKTLQLFKREGLPPLCTHELTDEMHDPIINHLKSVGLTNKESDKVKVLFYPVYIDGNDNLMNMSYYDVVIGCHLGIFPSYYEPWGYTPLESATLGVPCVTTDLAGFGRYVKNTELWDNKGVVVLNREHTSKQEHVEECAQAIYDFTQLDHNGRVNRKMHAKKIAELCDWQHFVKNYIDAHNRALAHK